MVGRHGAALSPNGGQAVSDGYTKPIGSRGKLRLPVVGAIVYDSAAFRGSATALAARTFQGRKGIAVSVTVRELAELVHGKVLGDGERLIDAARPLSEVQAGDITFLESDKHAPQLAGSVASAAVVA